MAQSSHRTAATVTSQLVDWTVDCDTKEHVAFVNADRGLELHVRAVYAGRTAKRSGREPTHFAVSLHQDWFAKGVLGDRNLAAKVETREEALAVAREFMAEFSRELQALPVEAVEAVHRAAVDHELAADMLVSEVAAEALADAAGYSDELLLSVLDAATDGRYLLVAHRDGRSVTTVAGDADSLPGDVTLQTVHGVFPIDRGGVGRVLSLEPPFVTTVHLDECTVYRFIFDDAKETDVVLQRGTPVSSPAFETSITNVLEEKW